MTISKSELKEELLNLFNDYLPEKKEWEIDELIIAVMERLGDFVEIDDDEDEFVEDE